MTTVLLTGASGGIGRELAIQMASRGMDLIVVARNCDRLSRLADRIRKQHRVQVDCLACDLGEPDGVASLVRHIADRRIDILVNNAGRGDYGYFRDIDWAQHSCTLRLNVVALTMLTHAVVPAMIANGSGYIVNIASTASFQPLPWMATYGASKAYVLSFGEALAHELEGSGVEVLTLCPGATKTGFARAANANDSKNFDDRTTASVDDVARYAMSMISERKRGVAVHGLGNRLRALLSKVLPSALTVPMAGRAMRPR